MSNATPIRCRTIEDVNLPAPATKLIITQHLKASQESPYWAWIIVGAFYDRDNNIVWSTEVFAGHLDVEDSDLDEISDFDVEEDSDKETSDGESVASSSEAEGGQSDTEETDSSSDVYPSSPEAPDDDIYFSDLEASDDAINYPLDRRYRDEVAQARQVYPNWYESASYASPPENWDPTRQGPVPGYWQASFDPRIRRWVHTWQPLW